MLGESLSQQAGNWRIDGEGLHVCWGVTGRRAWGFPAMNSAYSGKKFLFLHFLALSSYGNYSSLKSLLGKSINHFLARYTCGIKHINHNLNGLLHTAH